MSTRKVPAEITAQYEQALEAGDIDGVLAAAGALQESGHSRSAEAWLRHALSKFPDAPRIVLRLLEIYLRYRSWEDFDSVGREAQSRHPDDPDLVYTIGCGYEARGMWGSAARSFGRAAELAPDEIEPVLRQARSLRVEGHRDEAIRVLKAAISRHSDAAALHAALGYTYIDMGRPLDAARCFEAAFDHQPDWPTYLDDLAGALMLAEKWEAAAAAATRSLEARKKNERAWTVFAIAHSRLGNDGHADQGYKNAIRAAKDPSRAEGNYGLFLARDPAQLLEAVRMLKAAQAAHPDWSEVTEALGKLLSSSR